MKLENNQFENVFKNQSIHSEFSSIRRKSKNLISFQEIELQKSSTESSAP